MLTKFVVLFLFVLGIIALIALYIIKVGTHLQLINVENGKEPGRVIDLFFFNFSDASAKADRTKALLRYPLLFPVEMEEDEPKEVLEIKQRIKKINIAVYAVLIVMFLLVTYSSKAYPEGLF